jgi:hypothetical protein
LLNIGRKLHQIGKASLEKKEEKKRKPEKENKSPDVESASF